MFLTPAVYVQGLSLKEAPRGLPSKLRFFIRICLQCRRPWFDSWVGKISWRRDRLPTPVFLGFPGGSAGEAVMRETWVQPLGREDPLEKRKATHSNILARRIPWTEEPGIPWTEEPYVYGVTKSRTQLSDFHFTSLHFTGLLV